MNKQQLAQKIWASANQMRSKIEANEYKDYILGFIFYKYLSDKEIQFLKENDYDDENLKKYLKKILKQFSIFSVRLATSLHIKIYFLLGFR